jgi:tRNA (cytidine/uridine-2'-O-)-methyltransferase
VFRILFHSPEIPGNTGNAIRLAAITGAELHLVEPLGFDFSDAKLRRAGLDYHDLAVVTVHKTIDDASYADIAYKPGDVLMFGQESVGLPEDVKRDPHVTATVRLPMLPSLRSLNLANAASIAVYEAWRQQGFTGAQM